VAAAVGPTFWRQAAIAGTPPPQQVHLEFGDDPARQMTVSWATSASVGHPRVRYGAATADLGAVVAAETVTFKDGESGTTVWCHHARLGGLSPATAYAYEVVQDGATAVGSAFRTAPIGRRPFRFTSFGDQCTGTIGDALATPQGSWVVDQIEAADPLFHLVNGDLSYANTLGSLKYDRSTVWDHWFTNSSRSTMQRPWMPTLGNHENEKGNGAHGVQAYLTRFALPGNASRGFEGNWYAFTVGSVRFVSLDTNDVAYSTDFDFVVRGYSDGSQARWLESQLDAARRDPGIDWIVVFIHYPVMSTAGGSDLGVRERFQPLMDEYGVDLVLTGHSHDYERMYPVRGVVRDSPTLEPRTVATSGDSFDTSLGAVHLVIGTGGVALPTPTYGGLPTDPTAGVTMPGGGTDTEPAPYSAVRAYESPYGFLVVDVDPGDKPGGATTMTLQYFNTQPISDPPLPALDTVTLHRRRRDGPPAR